MRTCTRQLKDTVAQIRANHMWPQAPEVCTGVVFELQKKSFSEWYSKAYSEDTPLCVAPLHVLFTVKKMQATMACRSTKNRV